MQLSSWEKKYLAVFKRVTVSIQHIEEYKIWVGMIGRCYNRADPFYKDYGGKGIRVSRRWLASFDNFLADMGPRPASYWLSRHNSNRGYVPSNCFWIEPAELNRKRMRLRKLKKPAQTGHFWRPTRHIVARH